MPYSSYSMAGRPGLRRSRAGGGRGRGRAPAGYGDQRSSMPSPDYGYQGSSGLNPVNSPSVMSGQGSAPQMPSHRYEDSGQLSYSPSQRYQDSGSMSYSPSQRYQDSGQFSSGGGRPDYSGMGNVGGRSFSNSYQGMSDFGPGTGPQHRLEGGARRDGRSYISQQGANAFGNYAQKGLDSLGSAIGNKFGQNAQNTFSSLGQQYLPYAQQGVENLIGSGMKSVSDWTRNNVGDGQWGQGIKSVMNMFGLKHGGRVRAYKNGGPVCKTRCEPKGKTKTEKFLGNF